MDLITCPWCSTKVIPKPDHTCPSCCHTLRDVDAALVAAYRDKRHKEWGEYLQRDAAGAIWQSLLIMAVGLTLVAVQSLSSISLGNGRSMTVITWGVFVFGLYRLLKALLYRSWLR